MNDRVDLRIAGTKDDCLTVVALLSQTTPIVVKEIRENSHANPSRHPAWVCIDAEIPSTIRNP